LRAHGVGAINLAACRVEAEDGKIYHPPNLVHDGSAAVLEELGASAKFFPLFQQDTACRSLILNAKASSIDRSGSQHPSVKPVSLLRHLVRLYTPPGGVVLDPFAGSGTTAEAAIQEGFECVLVERDPEYVGDIVRRFGITPAGNRKLSIDDLV